ncbi:MAG: class I SAM-dependent methyltransferase [Candidatus Accumulibacter sp.]|nr:class I SAM-dependent methyltransferase [Accumulibacter sp.]
MNDKNGQQQWDSSSDPGFFEYYEKQSQSKATYDRFVVVRDKVIKLYAELGSGDKSSLDVADIGCGAGTQSLLWAQLGHRVSGIDINQPLIDLARKRAAEAGFTIRFEVGTATELPLDDQSMDVCLLPELLEHVVDWQSCLKEACRVLRSGGILYLSTTNVLCPKQEEFNLPFYSWYPGFLKRRYEHLAVTSRPELANSARYPAVNWFSYYQLAAILEKYGVKAYDRFDMIDANTLGGAKSLALKLLKSVPPVRMLGHMFISDTVIIGLKNSRY